MGVIYWVEIRLNKPTSCAIHVKGGLSLPYDMIADGTVHRAHPSSHLLSKDRECWR